MYLIIHYISKIHIHTSILKTKKIFVHHTKLPSPAIIPAGAHPWQAQRGWLKKGVD